VIEFEHRFGWDAAEAASNLLKHGVSFEPAFTVLLDPLARSIYDADHSATEDRWITLARASDGQLRWLSS
jgi:uncharacterized protein